MRFYTHIAGGILLFTLLVWLFNLPFSMVGILFTGWISILPDLVDRVTGDHRGWGHSVIWLIPITTSFLINSTLGIAFLSGFMMHILFDIVTRKGVPFLYPFSNTRLVMPKKEKSRIMTGSKQEIALFIVVILLFAPVAYGVVQGYDLGSALGGSTGNNTLNKANKTNSALDNFIKYATGNLRSNNSYPKSSYSPSYNSGHSSNNSKKSSSSSSQNSSSESNPYQNLLDWLTNNQPTEDTSNETNQTNDNIITDVLFGDIAAGSPYDNLKEGQVVESDFIASSDNSTIDFLDGFGLFGDSNSGEDGSFDSDNNDGWFDDLGYMIGAFLLSLEGLSAKL